jgi:asparagine synthase (glutamine-hydrolysing)
MLHAMCGAIAHRGPDDEGIHVAGPIGLGMRRLSIIDVAGGSQPIFNETGEVSIVFNGEVYNHKELRRWLLARGHQFTTKSDTEAVLHLYEERGAECVADLRGMFAFAIWDDRRRTLMLARDRFGKKPLYYAADAGGLAFASELKSLLVLPDQERRLDPEGVNQFLTFGNTLGETTILSHVRKVPPGHVLVAREGELKLSRYWRWRVEEDPALDEATIVERLRELLDEAVRIRLIAEVPLGAFLSGGLDSSTVVAFMSQHSHEPVSTFAMGCGTAGFDERPFAREVARHFGTVHREKVLQPSAAKILREMVWHLDEPFADSSAIPTYFLSQLGREHVTVALSGDGGDEMFAGYPSYRADFYLGSVRRVPANLRNWALERLLKPVGVRGPTRLRGPVERCRRNLERVDLSPEDRFLSRHCLFSEDVRAEVLTEEARAFLATSHIPSQWARLEFDGHTDHVTRALYLDVNVYLPDDMLVKVDRMSMAHALEVRCPMLDHKLAEFMGTVPARYKVRRGHTKYILRRAMTGILPESILRRGKQGFCVPLEQWFEGGLVRMARDVLLEDATCVRRRLLDPRGIAAMLDAQERGLAAHGERIWALLMLETWCRFVLDGEAA